jgi:tetratricopeptide (TPR) repeat protein
MPTIRHQRKNTVFQVFILAALLLFFPLNNLFAQAKLTASASSSSVALNSSVEVTYSLTGGSAESFSAPSFSDFSVVETSHSSGGGMTLIVNGKVVQNGGGEESWIYTLVPTAIGKFTIPAAKVKVKGQWVSSNTVAIEVTKSATNQNQSTNQTQKSTSSDAGSSNDLFIKAYVDKTNPVVGEQIIVSYKIYTRIPVTQYAINKLSSFSGFWTQDLNKDQSTPKQYTETINGSKYTVADIRKVACFAQKSGKLTIEPLEVECIAQVQVKGNANPFGNFFNDPFFQNAFSSVQNVKRTLKSNAITVNVNPLPTNDKPADFSGAVGNFTFKGEIDRTEVKQNEAINLKFTVSGSGNINLIDKPNVEFPTDFEVYDPQINDNITTAGDKVSGSRTYEYLIIPRNAGAFDIKPVTFSYYDLNKKAYVTTATPAFHIKVAKGEGGGSTVYGGSGKEDVKYIGSDVRYMDQNVFPLQHIGWFFFNSPLYYVFLSIPVLLFILFLIIWRRRLKIRSNVALLKNMKATGVARKRLITAHHFMHTGERESFYVEIARALWGYVSDKFTIPISALSLETVRETLLQKNLAAEMIDSLIETLNSCEYARFAPADPSLAMGKIYGEAADFISHVEQEVKNNQKKPVNAINKFALFGLLFFIFSTSYAGNINEMIADSANQAYASGKFNNAVILYQKVIANGYESAGVYYNLGNAYFKVNDMASAILYFEKSLKLRPGEENTEFNLKVAQTRIVDKIDELPLPFYARVWNWLGEIFPVDIWGYLIIISITLTLLFAAFYLLTSRISIRKLTFWIGVLFLLCTCIFNLAAYSHYYHLKNVPEAIIFDATVHVKSSPAENSTDIFVIHEGTKVRITDQVGEWNEIHIANGSVGWVKTSVMQNI